MYILALFQYGCPRMFFCFPLGPKIKSGSISKEMLRGVIYTRGSIGFRDWFLVISIKRKNQRSFSFKAHCVWKKLP